MKMNIKTYPLFLIHMSDTLRCMKACQALLARKENDELSTACYNAMVYCMDKALDHQMTAYNYNSHVSIIVLCNAHPPIQEVDLEDHLHTLSGSIEHLVDKMREDQSHAMSCTSELVEAVLLIKLAITVLQNEKTRKPEVE